MIEQFDLSIPRYTSYPTAPEWVEEDVSFFDSTVKNRSLQDPLSLYVHIPFCRSLCFYCGCNSLVNRSKEREASYVDAVLAEIELVSLLHAEKPCVNQIHFGGGSPSLLEPILLEKIVNRIFSRYRVSEHAEIAIEIDPRTVFDNTFEKLELFKKMGFTRVSIGVQDTVWEVQQAIGRNQSWDLSLQTYRKAKEKGFSSVNIDLIYGLPRQTVRTFEQTIHNVLEMRPDRIALFSYAHLPQIKPHQRAIDVSLLPSVQEKFSIYSAARQTLIDHGYIAIGMDHFATPEDPLAVHLLSGTLKRNFQGYTGLDGDDMIGFGLSSISQFQTGFFQNTKTLSAYMEKIGQGRIPLERGKQLSLDDRIRRFIIHSLMCRFAVNLYDCFSRFQIDPKSYFLSELENIDALVQKGLVLRKGTYIQATESGKLFIRNIASCFDAYLHKTKRRFSQAV